MNKKISSTSHLIVTLFNFSVEVQPSQMCRNLSAIMFKGHMKQPVDQANSPNPETLRQRVVHQAGDISNLSLVDFKSGFVELASLAPP